MIKRDGPELSRPMAGSASASQVCQLEETGGEIGKTNKVATVRVQCTVEHIGGSARHENDRLRGAGFAGPCA
jgi:hypothetical protein